MLNSIENVVFNIELTFLFPKALVSMTTKNYTYFGHYKQKFKLYIYSIINDVYDFYDILHTLFNK